MLLGNGNGTFAPARNFAVLQAPQSIALDFFGGHSGSAVVSTPLNEVAVYQDVVSYPAAASRISVARSALTFNVNTKLYDQTVTLTNAGGTITGPIYLVLDNLSPAAEITGAGAVTSCGGFGRNNPYVSVAGPLLSGASAKLTLQFVNPRKLPFINYTPVVLVGSPMRLRGLVHTL